MSYPDLQLDPLVIPVDGLHLEVDAHSAHEGWGERVVGITKQEARLAHTAVADDQDLEHVVKVLVGGLLLSIASICSWGHLWRDAAD